VGKETKELYDEMEEYEKGLWGKELESCMRMEEYEKGVWGKELESGMRMEGMMGWKCMDARHCTYVRDVERTQKEQ
jgi:hypothetical protein